MSTVSDHKPGVMLCLHPCPPWGFCATQVTPEQAIRGVCGSKNGVHGYDGYVKESAIAAIASDDKDRP